MSQSTNQTVSAQPTTSSSDADLHALVQQLLARVDSLEAEVNDLRASQAVPDDVVVAIGAAVAAFLGHKARVRAIRLSGTNRWATEERATMHNRAVTRTR